MKKKQYKKICGECKHIFFTDKKNKNICSKLCRKKSGHPYKNSKIQNSCIVCGWNATLDEHHENGKKYLLCPNHHALISRELQTLEEVLSHISYDPMSKINLIIQKLHEVGLENFTYKDVQKLMNWKYNIAKKQVLKLLFARKILYKIKSCGGKNKEVIFTLNV